MVRPIVRRTSKRVVGAMMDLSNAELIQVDQVNGLLFAIVLVGALVLIVGVLALTKRFGK